MLLITGGTGYVGQKLLQRLPNNQKTLVLSRSAKKLPFKNVEVIVGDLLKPETLSDKFQKVTKVIHLASSTHAYSDEEYWQQNFEGTKNLIQALPKNIGIFIYSSTNCAVPGAGGYGESKLAVEKLLLQTYSNVVILKIGDVFAGSGEKSLEKLFDLVKQSTIIPMIGFSQKMLAPVHVDDLIYLLYASQDLKGQHTFIVTGLEQIPFRVLLKKVAQRLKKNVFIVSLPVFFINLLIKILITLDVGDYYPDQVKRFVVNKELDSKKTWKFFSHKPLSFSQWLKSTSL